MPICRIFFVLIIMIMYPQGGSLVLYLSLLFYHPFSPFLLLPLPLLFSRFHGAFQEQLETTVPLGTGNGQCSGMPRSRFLWLLCSLLGVYIVVSNWES